jgi:ribosome biogenesis protein BMS1
MIEVGQSLCDLIDAAKLADLVLLCVDGSYGFEMETFEFLNVLQVHGFPKVMGVLTHLDHFKEPKKLKKTKKVLKQRFWTEIYDGAKLFYISGMTHGRYNQRDVVNLARFISVAKPRPLMFRSQHPYVIGDRFEDLTRPEMVHENEHIDREEAVCSFSCTISGLVKSSNLSPITYGCCDLNINGLGFATEINLAKFTTSL